MHRLIDGVLRFQSEIHNPNRERFTQLGESQAPFAMFIACSDSRVVPEVLTQRDPGDLFVVRNAGNIIPSYGPAAGGVSASIEYAVAALGIENVVVCGHSDCGAMKAILREDKLDRMPAVASWIKHSDAAKEIVKATLPEGPAIKPGSTRSSMRMCCVRSGTCKRIRSSPPNWRRAASGFTAGSTISRMGPSMRSMPSPAFHSLDPRGSGAGYGEAEGSLSNAMLLKRCTGTRWM